jgi:hypothetical protein
VLIPVTHQGMLLKVKTDENATSFTSAHAQLGPEHGLVALCGHTKFTNGVMGPLEMSAQLDIGDCIIAVNGVSCINKSFDEVVARMQEASKDSVFFWVRWLSNAFCCIDPEWSSMGKWGPGTCVPDVRTPEGQAYFTAWGKAYLDAGCRAFYWGGVG